MPKKPVVVRKRKPKMTKRYDKEAETLVVVKEQKVEPKTEPSRPADPHRGKLEALLKAIQDCKDLPGSDFDLRDIEAAVIKRLNPAVTA